MAEPVLLVDRDGAIATVTLNRPAKMNALNQELRTAIADAFSDLQADPEVRVAILTGAGRAFCAGLDLRELGAGNGPVGGTIEGGRERNVMKALGQFDGPIIGAINGVAVTGGFELALACDLLIGTPQTRFADTHARVGILPGWGLSAKLARVIGIYRAKELSLTGNYLEGEQAAAWGLLSRCVAPDELLPVCRALAEDMLSCVPEALRGYKRMIDAGFATNYAEALHVEQRLGGDNNRKVTPDAVAERRANIQRRGREQTGNDA